MKDGGGLAFDDALFDPDRAIEMLGAATIAKIAAIHEALSRGDLYDARTAANDAALWLREWGIAVIESSRLIAEMMLEVPGCGGEP